MPTPDLAGLLRRPKAATTPAPAPQESPLSVPRDGPAGNPAGTTPAVAAASPQTQTRRRPAASKTKPVPATEVGTAIPDQPAARRQYLRSITVYLPRSVHEQVRTEATARATTATALMLAAVNGTHDRLENALAPTETTDEHALFDIPQAREAGEPTVQTTIRITDRQMDAIVALANVHDVNRSRLIATALRLHLG